jgi:hypothetical protein
MDNYMTYSFSIPVASPVVSLANYPTLHSCEYILPEFEDLGKFGIG